MKHFIIGILAFLLIAALAPISTQAGEVKTEIKDVPAFWYVSMEFKGSFDNFPKNVGIFMNTFFGQGLKPTGPMLGIYHNDPDKVKVEDLKWEVGFTVPKDTTVKAPLKITEFKSGKAAVHLYTGPYEKIAPTYEKIEKFLAEKGYEYVFPGFEKYLNNPMNVKPEELKTEIMIPVKKK